MEQVASHHKSGGALFVAVPDGDTEFGYGITSSTTHFSCFTEGFLSTLLQRFGYNVQISRREFRPDAKEICRLQQIHEYAHIMFHFLFKEPLSCPGLILLTSLWRKLL